MRGLQIFKLVIDAHVDGTFFGLVNDQYHTGKMWNRPKKGTVIDEIGGKGVGAAKIIRSSCSQIQQLIAFYLH